MATQKNPIAALREITKLDIADLSMGDLPSDPTKVSIPTNPTSFTINGSAPVAGATLPAALGAPTLTLLGDVITYCATLQTRLDLQEGIIRQLLGVLTTAGLVAEA